MFVSFAALTTCCSRRPTITEAAYVFCSLEELVAQQLLTSQAWTSSKVRVWAAI